MRDCLLRGEAPFASHALYTQPGVLDDGKTDERAHGIDAGFEWRHVADVTVFYTDLGWSTGMQYGAVSAERLAKVKQHEIEHRTLGPDWEQRAIECERSFVTRWP